MLGKRTASFTVGTLAMTALLSAATPSHAQQGWPINQPTGSASFPWNSPGYRGYDESQNAVRPIISTVSAGKPQKYELNVNALSMMKNTEDPNAVSLVAHVPENAHVWFDGKPTTTTGKLRTFYYGGLNPGSKYSYAVRVAWVEDGKMVNQTQTLSFKPGDVQCVYLIQAGSEVKGEKDALQVNLAKLSANDRKLAEKQNFCAVQNTVRLGAMGTPTKVTLQGEPVFLCCDACLQRAQSNAEKTLAKAKELKEQGNEHDHSK